MSAFFFFFYNRSGELDIGSHVREGSASLTALTISTSAFLTWGFSIGTWKMSYLQNHRISNTQISKVLKVLAASLGIK